MVGTIGVFHSHFRLLGVFGVLSRPCAAQLNVCGRTSDNGPALSFLRRNGQPQVVPNVICFHLFIKTRPYLQHIQRHIFGQTDVFVAFLHLHWLR